MGMTDLKEKIVRMVSDLAELEDVSVDENTPLIGSTRIIKSRALVELCLALEDYAEELGFEFDWTSEAAMSQSRSIFRTVGSLVGHFETQRQTQ